MSLGINDLARQIKHLRSTIEKLFSKELIGQLESLLANINQSIGSPETQSNIAEIIAQIKNALNSINNSEIINNVDNVVKKIKAILDNIDNKQVATLFSDITNLVHQVVEADIIGKITTILESANSLSGLKKFAEFLMRLSPTLFYTAGPLGSLFQKLLNKTIDTSDEKILKQILELERKTFFLQLMQLRTENSINYTLSILTESLIRDKTTSADTLNKILEERSYSEKILKLPMIDSTTMDSLSLASEQCEDLIRSLHNYTKEAKKIEHVLDNISISSIHTEHWNKIVHGCVFQLTEFDDQIIFNQEELNYKQVQRFYGKENVTIVMQAMASKLIQSGGEDIYYAVANTLGSAPGKFTNLNQIIPRSLNNENDIQDHQLVPEEYQLPLSKLRTFYHAEKDGALSFLNEKWNELQEKNPNLPLIKEEASKIIILRALLEQCTITGKYFFAPYNLPREIGNGTIDFFVGTYSSLRHPIDTIVNMLTLPYDLATDRNGRRTALTSTLYNHPTRVATSLLIAGGAGYITAGHGGIPHSTHSVTNHPIVYSARPEMFTSNQGLLSVSNPTISLTQANTSASILLTTNMPHMTQNEGMEEKHDNLFSPKDNKINYKSTFDLNEVLEHTKKSRKFLAEIANHYNADISDYVSTPMMKPEKNDLFTLFNQAESSNKSITIKQSKEYSESMNHSKIGKQ